MEEKDIIVLGVIHYNTACNGTYGHISVDFQYRDEDGKLRSLPWWYKEDMYMERLQVHCQMSLDFTYPYAIETRFVTNDLNLTDGEKMLKTLRFIDRKLERINKKQGYAQSFGEYVWRVLSALGIEEAVDIYGQVTTTFTDLNELANKIDQRASEKLANWHNLHINKSWYAQY